MKKILLITVRSDSGGGPKHVLDILKGLGNEVDFYTAAPAGFKYSDEFEKYSKFFLPIKHRSFSITSLFKIISLLIKEDIEIIHSHGFGAGIYSRILFPFSKILHTFHGLHLKKSIKNQLKQLIEKFFSLLTNKSIFVSDSEFKTAQKINLKVSHYEIIPNGIALPENIQSLQLKKDPNEILIGTLTRLEEHKGNHLLIKHFQHLPQNYRLFIAGMGPDLESLKTLAQDLKLHERVSFLGEVEAFPFLKAIDIYVSCSLGEGMPYSVLEAIGLRKFIVLSDVEGHKDLVKEESLFDLNSSDDFIEKISHPSNLTPFNHDLAKSLSQLKEVYLKL